MTQPEWSVRSIRNTRTDRDRLAKFLCSDRGSTWADEVEDFVRTLLFGWRYEPHAQGSDPRVLLLFHRQSKRLIGIAGHERTALRAGDGTEFPASKLEVIAIAADWQGRKFATGERASDVLMASVMTDVVKRIPPRFARVLALVHEDNTRSLALCARHGLTVNGERFPS